MAAVSREFFLSFLLGCSVGVLFTVIYNEIMTCMGTSCAGSRSPISHINSFSKFLTVTEDEDRPALPPVVYNRSLGPIVFNDLDSMHQKDGSIIAKKLSQKVRILCWVMTNPKTLYTKGQAVKDTWGKRCNVLVFFSSVEDKKFPAVGLDVPEGMLLSLNYFFLQYYLDSNRVAFPHEKNYVEQIFANCL